MQHDAEIFDFEMKKQGPEHQLDMFLHSLPSADPNSLEVPEPANDNHQD